MLEPQRTYTACPFSNLVLGTNRALADQQFDYANLRATGVTVLHTNARAVDPVAKTVTSDDGRAIAYDRLVMAPGIDFDWTALPGYDEAASRELPHAWQAGQQTVLLRDQLRTMRDGGVVVIVAPDNPFRCPPGPYERASLIAHYLARHKPRSKVLILDAKDQFSKKSLFLTAWRTLYGTMIEWQGLSDGARVTSVDAAERTLHTDFDSVNADVANVIPTQTAGKIAQQAGVADTSRWCPIDAATFESTLQPGIHVIGDAAIANAMPKSAFAANAQARYCAAQILRLLAGESPLPAPLLNTCYSLVAPDYGISVAGVYRPVGASWQEVDGAGGTSPADTSADVRRAEAAYANDWYQTLTGSVFGRPN